MNPERDEIHVHVAKSVVTYSGAVVYDRDVDIVLYWAEFVAGKYAPDRSIPAVFLRHHTHLPPSLREGGGLCVYYVRWT